MATDFIMPRICDQQPQPRTFFQHKVGNQMPSTCSPLQNNSPTSPISTPSNASPQSPRLHYGRQVPPLYMPAVLRPNEHPSRPVKNRARVDSGISASTDSTPSSPVPHPSTYFGVIGGAAFGWLRRRSTDDSKKSCETEDGSLGRNLDCFPVVTDMPTRNHWKPDSESTICDEPTCKRYFSYFTRRHHCRRCGNIFCDQHSSYGIPLDQHAEYNPRANALSRSCNHCYSEYNAWRSRTNSQASSTASSEASLHVLSRGRPFNQDQGITPSPGSSLTPASPAPINTPNPNSLNNARSPDGAGSLPRYWDWSTF